MGERLQDIIDLEELRALMLFFYEAAGISVGVMGADRHWLVTIGWQDICVNFHRTNPVSKSYCLLSEFRAQQYGDQENYFVYPCPNGLVEVAAPILLNDSPIGYFFLGQFLYQPPDRDFFRRQAIQLGFDIDGYLAALDKVPVVSEERVEHLMAFFKKFFNLLTRIGFENQQRRLAEQESLKAREQLESRVEERTRELNDALMDISDMASQLNESLQRVEHLAVTDRLTDSYNRRKFDEVVVSEHQRAVLEQAPFSLIMFDIDHFKRINDQHGHSVGDEVLRHLVRLVKSLIRQGDVLIRWGGEEFLILLPGTKLKEAGFFAERIRASVEKEPLSGIAGVTVSLGVAQLRGGDTTDSLLKRVDTAMYRAKEGGRNRVCLCTEFAQKVNGSVP